MIKGTDLQTTDISVLWNLYKEQGDEEAKDELLFRYLYLVRRIVRRMMPKYNSYNEFDDLVNCGVLGLIDAIGKFDLKHGVKFETYAMTRIRGEILDYMREQDWAPSSLRRKITQIAETASRIELASGLQPDDQRLADEMDMPVEQVRKILTQSHLFNLVNFEDTLTGGYIVMEAPAPEEKMPENLLIDKDLKQTLGEIIDELPEREKLVITLYYYEELMFKEIAEIMEVSESRVSQIHSKVLLKMKEKLQKFV